MTFDAKMDVDGGVVSLTLTGEADSRAADKLNELIIQAAEVPPSRLVLIMHELTFLSSAGLRCLVFAQQRLGSGVEIVLVGARPEVAETIKLTGFDRSVTMQEQVAR